MKLSVYNLNKIKTICEDVAWFLYECNSRCNKIWFEDKEYIINSTEDYLHYAKRELFKDE